MKRFLLASGVLVLLLFMLLFAAGSIRYGGPDGLLLRVRAEFAPERPVDFQALAPTPLPTPIPTATPSPTIVADPSVTPTASADLQPSHTPTRPPSPTPTPTPTPPPLYSPANPDANLTGLSHYWQSWNNCGPATLAMQLSYFGSDLKQEAIRKQLRPNKEDKNVNPWELAAFAKSVGYQALVRVNGDSERLKLFLSNGIPVLIETWLLPKPLDGMGHYRLLTGYDDEKQVWITYDSYVSTGVNPKQAYQGVHVSYAEIDKFWPVFNHTYIVIYTDEQAPLVKSILGADFDAESNWRSALTAGELAVTQTPDDAFVWFNLGTDLVALGRYDEAAAAYDQARILGLPWRMHWYQFGPFRAYYETGRYDEVLSLADATLKTTIHVEELHYWRGKALQALGDLNGARKAYELAIKLNKNYVEAINELSALATS